MPNFETDDECTAEAGVMGHVACHLYPGCGCYQDRDEEKKRWRDPVYRRPEKDLSPAEEGNFLHNLLELELERIRKEQNDE